MNISDSIATIMTTNVVTVSPSQKLIDVKHIYEKKQFHHHIPVVENGKFVGMISLIDFMIAIKDAGLRDDEKVYSEKTVKDIMSVHPFSKSSTASIKDVAQELAKGEFHAVVIADDSILKGIVSTADVIRYFVANS
ncbi:MAG: CBS domain-containing protein [Bacteroidota bacterium]